MTVVANAWAVVRQRSRAAGSRTFSWQRACLLRYTLVVGASPRPGSPTRALPPEFNRAISITAGEGCQGESSGESVWRREGEDEYLRRTSDSFPKRFFPLPIIKRRLLEI